ncbi:hypothetical protein [Streptomyces sp. NPDC052225]|uniref:hypothetical protein n=1 Tax=Streptomyces sp. NPDC052225 TaxID=3154949 RepID=UPI003421F2EF
MTDVVVLALGTVTVWVLVFMYYLGTRRRPARRTPFQRAQPDYSEGLERMRAAIAASYRETVPGPPSQDLVECWAIWSDPPGVEVAEDEERDT